MATGDQFGCGDYLPGKGPDNFKDYDPPVDEVDEPVDPPGGPGADPIDGGDAAPPWREKPPPECICIPQEPTVTSEDILGSIGIEGNQIVIGKKWTVTFAQKCTSFPNGFTAPDSNAITDWKSANQGTLDSAENVQEFGDVNQDCAGDAGECCSDPIGSTPCCPSYVITYEIRFDSPIAPGGGRPIGPPGPSDPGGGGPSTLGPPGPAAPGGSVDKVCKCILDFVDFGNLDLYFTDLGSNDAGGQNGTYTFSRSCKKVDAGTGDGLSTVYTEVEKHIRDTQNGRITGTNTSSGNACKKTVNPDTLKTTCTGECDDFIIYVYIPPSVSEPIGGGVLVDEEDPVITTDSVTGQTQTDTVVVTTGSDGGVVSDPVTDQIATDTVIILPDTDGGIVSDSVSDQTALDGLTTEPETEPDGPETGGGELGEGVIDDSIVIDDDIVESDVFVDGQVDFGGSLIVEDGPGGGPGVTTTSTGGIAIDDYVRNPLFEDDPIDGDLEIDTAKQLGELVQFSQSEQVTLNDPRLVNYFTDKEVAGLLDEDIALTKRLKRKAYVSFNNRALSIFKEHVHESIDYILKFSDQLKTWDHNPIFDLTTQNIIASLSYEFLTICRSIKRSDGTNLSNSDIANIVRNRLISRDIASIDLDYLRRIANTSYTTSKFNIERSNNMNVNEGAAYYYMTKVGIPLDTTKLPGASKYTINNWKTLATDLAKYIPIIVDGEEKKYYIKDTDEFIDRSSLKLSDGDYFNIYIDGTAYRLFAGSEKDHAYILRSEDRQVALELLGSSDMRYISASSLASDEIEFNYSLSTPRENFYLLSCNLSSIQTSPVGNSNTVSNLVKETTAQYDLVDHNDESSLSSFNEYIKYKVNGKTLLIHDEDRIIDYLENTSSITYTQNDILFNVSKSSKNTSLFVRQLPLWLILFPTNRFDYNVAQAKSKILSYDPSGKIVRTLYYKPSLNIKFNKDSVNFIDYDYVGLDGVDVFGKYESLGRSVQITPTKEIFTTGYRQDNALKSAKEFAPSRKVSGLRQVKNIISEISNNYLLDDEGLGLGVNTFDVFSRLTLDEYNSFMLEDGANQLLPSLKNGMFEGVRLYEPVKNAGTNASKKTRLVQRKVDAPADIFVPIKYLRTGQTIEPPGTTFNSSELTRTPTRKPTR